MSRCCRDKDVCHAPSAAARAADRTGLLPAYVSAYRERIRQDASWWRTLKWRRFACKLAHVACATLAGVFAGVALMLHAVTGNGYSLPWGVPALPLAGALVALWILAGMPRDDALGSPFGREFWRGRRSFIHCLPEAGC